MHRILEAFANDELQIEADIDQRSAEHQKVCDLSDRLEEKLRKRLEDDEKQLLTQLIDALTIESSYYAEERFIRGYQLGTLMTIEVFMDLNTFMQREIDRA